jgi:hypothetical protein
VDAKYRKTLTILMLLRLALAAVWGQEIQTAFSYFDLMSERYGRSRTMRRIS